MLTPDRLEEITRYCLGGIALPPEMQRELLNEIERLRTSRSAAIAGLSKKHCPPPPHDECPAQPVTLEVCNSCWMSYFNTMAVEPADIKEGQQ